MTEALCVLLGLVVGFFGRRAWCEASASDRLEALRDEQERAQHYRKLAILRRTRR